MTMLPLAGMASRFGYTGDADASPSPDGVASPSPAHLHKHRAHPSPTPDDEIPSPTPRQAKAHDEDSSQDVTPSPSPGHPRKHRLHKSPTPDDETASPAPKETKALEEDTSADVTPSPHRKKHHPLVGTDADAVATPAVTPSATAENSEAESASPSPKPSQSFAPDASLDSSELEDFAAQPPKVQALLESALQLTRQNLTYTYSSDDPANGGMDCSGFIYYVLTQAGLPDVPRDASEQYSWVRKADNFRAVISRRLDGFELDELKPGDLLFWSGTYNTNHDPPVSHTMIYLGREKSTGDRVMVGSTDGRTYHGLRRWGVSVFDFKPVSAASPPPGATAPRFIGYGAIPGL